MGFELLGGNSVHQQATDNRDKRADDTTSGDKIEWIGDPQGLDCCLGRKNESHRENWISESPYRDIHVEECG